MLSHASAPFASPPFPQPPPPGPIAAMPYPPPSQPQGTPGANQRADGSAGPREAVHGGHSHAAHARPAVYQAHAKAPHEAYPVEDLPGGTPSMHLPHGLYPPTPSPRSEGLNAQGERARAHEGPISFFPAAHSLPGHGQPGQPHVQPFQPHSAPRPYRTQEAPEEALPAYHGQGPSPQSHLEAPPPSAGPGHHQQSYPSGVPVGYKGGNTPVHAGEVDAQGAPQWSPYQAFPTTAAGPQGPRGGPYPGFPPHIGYAPADPQRAHPALPAGYPLPSPQGQQGAGTHLAVPPSTPLAHPPPPAPMHVESPAGHAHSSHPPQGPPPFYSQQLGAPPGGSEAPPQGQGSPPGLGARAPLELQSTARTPVLLPLTQALSRTPHMQAKSEEAGGPPASTTPRYDIVPAMTSLWNQAGNITL